MPFVFLSVVDRIKIILSNLVLSLFSLPFIIYLTDLIYFVCCVGFSFGLCFGKVKL